MYPSCIACKMILATLSNLLWESSLMESCFSRVTVKVLRDFRVVAVIREKNRPVPPKAIQTDYPTPLTNSAIDIPAVINVNVIRLVSTMAMIVMNRFIFLAFCLRSSISLRNCASILLNLFKQYVCGFCCGP